jgi:hypothetical protein
MKHSILIAALALLSGCTVHTYTYREPVRSTCAECRAMHSSHHVHTSHCSHGSNTRALASSGGWPRNCANLNPNVCWARERRRCEGSCQ